MQEAHQMDLPIDLKTHLKNIQRSYLMDETSCVNMLFDQISLSQADQKDIADFATELVQNVRANRKKFGGIDSFLQDFGLTTTEGISLMCLAEALLRIPDSVTADKMIKDKIGSAEWDQHIGKGSDLFVNASTWALMVTGKVIGDFSKDEHKKPSNITQNLVSKLGEPIVRKAMLHAMKIMGQQFVMGRTIEAALKRARDQERLGYRYSYDMLGEGARTGEDAERYFQNYLAAIEGLGIAVKERSERSTPVTAPSISVKLSALHPRYNYAQKDRCIPALTAKLKQLSLKAAEYNIGLTVDAEEVDRLEISLEIIDRVFCDPELQNWHGFGLALQVYQKRASFVIDWLSMLADRQSKRIMVRLVKGAYWDSEIKHAQELGLTDYPVFTRKNATDVSYIACASKLLARRDIFYPQFATHNAHTVASIVSLAGEDKTGFEFQRLHGMGEPLYHQLIGHEGIENGKYPVRVYAPVGCHEDLLPYLVRRLLENGANSSFVNRIQDDRIAITDMIADPIAYIKQLENKPHPKIPLPVNLFGHERANAMGFDFADTDKITPLLENVKLSAQENDWMSCPLIDGKLVTNVSPQPIKDPSQKSENVGQVYMAQPQDCKKALDTAEKAFKQWSSTPAEHRAEMLFKMANLIEENLAEFIALCVREAGKTVPDALAEVREAIDFCRYYAVQGKKEFGLPTQMPGPTGESNILHLTGRGIFLCISPWNFPLAIFLGQISAALMAGNTVIAKPAEQTPLIAAMAVKLFHKAGVPVGALTLLPATGEVTGKHIVTDPRIAGVAFTGSTETARIINQTLANKDGAIVPLIAETGGQNAMIVDTSALPEQIVDDIVISAFQSAGQRCSALRVLYLQEDIADNVITMLDGAAQELIMGDPLELKTDIGPVIDQTALDILNKHADRMDNEATLLTQVPQSSACDEGNFFAPRAYEITSISELGREVFGPIVHIIRYREDELDKVIDEINATGYGLTLGIHTRIEHTMRKIVEGCRVGNCYVNRSMIGAVVGVQPFGGQGLSGTGPKAGGPYYLHRFATEKTITINTTASGGNTTLVSLSEDDE